MIRTFAKYYTDKTKENERGDALVPYLETVMLLEGRAV